jgi:NADH/NAD ratio-sensing transcriptional regulator Rex
MPRDDIAHVLGIEPTTLRKYFSPFSDIGNTDAARAAVRLRKMGSELLRIAELMQDMARGKGGRDHG